MSVRSQNWLKFGGLVGLAFGLGLLFAGLLDLPTRSSAQQVQGITPVVAPTTPETRNLMELSDAFSAVAEHIRPSVVYVKSQKTERAPQMPGGLDQFFRFHQQQPEIVRGTGSGFIVSSDGYILTNNHVVDGASKVTVRLLDRREFDAHVVGTDPATDVAVLKIDAKNLDPAPLGNSDDAKIGQWVLAVGNPLGEGLAFTVTQGIVSAKGRALGARGEAIQDFIQTDAAINPGNSGGPLVNVQGQVIGINTAIASETGYFSGYGFAIPINLAQHVMDQIIKTGKVHRASLGVYVNDASAEDAEYVGLNQIRGVLVQSFTDNSPAEKAGLQPGDVIISVDGTELRSNGSTAQLQQLVGFKQPGEKVTVEVARKGGIRKTLTVKLAPMAETQTASNERGNPGDSGENGGSMLGLLGISVSPVTAEVRANYDLPDDMTGLVVTDVDPSGPAAEQLASVNDRAGPDIIVSVEGKSLKTEADLKAALRQVGAGHIISMRIFHPGAGFTIRRLRLGEQQ